MSFICIDETERGGRGFVKHAMPIDRSEIPDAQQATGDALNKMSTSIPTPFARLFLYSNAFNEVNVRQEDPNFSYTAHNEQTSYNALVGEWLDLMEFIFYYGNDDEMEIIPWNQVDIQNLKESNNEKHHRLAESLEAALKQTPALKSTTSINLFRYNGIIIGGTSPVSLLYMSPNLRTQLKESIPRSGHDNGYLFDDNVIPLYKREIDFRRFLQEFADLNRIDDAVTVSDELKRIFTYIQNEREFYDAAIKGEYDAARGKTGADAFHASLTDKNYEKIKNKSGHTLTVSSIIMWGKKSIIQPGGSQYEMIPTSDQYTKEYIAGAIKEVATPLVLSPQGMDGAIYYKEEKWNPIYIIPEPTSTILSTRKLPGFKNEIRPYVTIDDFLEKKIIWTAFNIQRNRFYTASQANLECLLPLKKEFFKFFNLDDLFEYNENEGTYTLKDMLTIEETDNDMETPTFKVTLSIPTAYGRNMEYVREYKGDNVIVCSGSTDMFDMAFFPFYKMDAGENIYNIMLGYKGNEKSFNIYSVDDIVTPVAIDLMQRSQSPVKTFHTRVQQAFDIVELVVGDTAGLIIPIMRQIRAVDISKDYVFCVDFGTTNTHVAYGEIAAGVVSAKTIKPLEIDDDNELQAVYLNDHEKGKVDAGFGFASDFLQPVMREFAPATIGKKYSMHYPMRTTVCEVPNLEIRKSSLFGTINIGYNYLSEIGTSSKCVYKTNIKWVTSNDDIKATDRIEVFFEEIMWIMKNKSVLNEGRPDFKFVFTYPQSMNKSLVKTFTKKWKDAREKVGAVGVRAAVTANFNAAKLEGVAPYYKFSAKFGKGAKYANIDIGGGTTDIIFIDPVAGGDKFSYSAKFAANDLWGDGTNSDASQENGFLLYYLSSKFYENLQSDTDKESLRNLMEKPNANSADIINYLFSKNESYDFVKALEASGNFKTLMLAHASAIIYYMAISFLRDGLDELPRYISFTGMGSKYLQILGDDDCISDVVNAVFNYRVGDTYPNPNIKVYFDDDPKCVTAQGGVRMFSNTEITPIESLPYGWKNEEYLSEHILAKDVNLHRNDLFAEMDTFLKMFEDPKFIKAVKDSINLNPYYLTDGLKQYVQASYDDIVSDVIRNSEVGDELDEPMFFWPLKDAIFQLGKQMSENGGN